MGRKAGKNKKKQKEIVLDPDEERRILNEKIELIEKDLEVMHQLNLEKEEEYAKTLNNYNKLETDRNDIIEYLQRILNQTLIELDIEHKELKILLQEKSIQDQRHTDVFAKMNLEYKFMQESLSSEIQMIDGKLLAMEEFRTQRNDLINKYKIQEEEFRKQEEIHKQEIYDLEKKLIKLRNQIKIGIDKTVEELDKELEDSSKIRIAAATNTIVKTNMQLNKELEKIMHSVSELNFKNTKFKNFDYYLRVMNEKLERQFTYVTKKSEQKMQCLMKLTKQIDQMNLNQMELNKLNDFNDKKLLQHELNKKLLSDTKKEIENTVEQIKLLNDENLDTIKHIKSTWIKNKYLKNIIQKAKSLVETIIDYEKIKSLDDKKFRGIFLSNLLEILLTSKNVPLGDRISEMSAESVYHSGSLGLITDKFAGEGRLMPAHESTLTQSIITETELTEFGEDMQTGRLSDDNAKSSSSSWVLASSGTLPLSNLTESDIHLNIIDEDVEEEEEARGDITEKETVTEPVQDILHDEKFEDEEEEDLDEHDDINIDALNSYDI